MLWEDCAKTSHSTGLTRTVLHGETDRIDDYVIVEAGEERGLSSAFVAQTSQPIVDLELC